MIRINLANPKTYPLDGSIPTHRYISVYAEIYANATASDYGILNMALPFVTIITKLFFCSLADRYGAHRSFFIVFLITALVGYGSFAVLPFYVKLPLEPGLNVYTWVIICIMTSVATISMSVISCLSDAFAINYSKKSDISYGKIRVWGTIGWGISAILLGYINQIDQLPELVPGLIMLIILIGTDIFAAVLWPDKSDFELDKSNIEVDLVEVISSLNQQPNTQKSNQLKSNNNHYGTTEQKPSPSALDTNTRTLDDPSSLATQWLLFKEVARRRRSIFRYLILFTISGALTALQWSYFFVFLKQTYPQDFTFISAISMVGQSILGELPFFLLSEKFVQVFGRSHTLSISIISLGIRYFLYKYLLTNASMYFVLLTEAFQGPCFGLFYVVLTEVGLDYSDCEDVIVKAVETGVIINDPQQVQKLRQALRATMQSLMSASYEGLGVGIGSIVGGLFIDGYGFDRLWFWSAMIATVLGFMNMALEIFKIPFLVDEKPILRTQAAVLGWHG